MKDPNAVYQAGFTPSLNESPLLWDFEEKARQTLIEWRKIETDIDSVDASIVSPEIKDSWMRCKRYGLDPTVKVSQKILSTKELQDLLKENETLVSSSLSFMENLNRFVDENYTVSLYDHQGIILAITASNDDIYRYIHEKYICEGVSWTERECGTNGASLVVETHRPVYIHATQHYCKFFHSYTSYGSPIFDPKGNFIGGICLTTKYNRTRTSFLGMTVSTAKAIENELRVQRALAESQLASSFQKIVISSIPEALITIDNQGFITLVNESAQRMFSFQYKRMEGKHIRSVFGVPNERFLNLLNRSDALTDAEVRITINNQGNDYTLTCNPILSHGGEMIGKILIFNEIKRAKTLVSKMIGARASLRFEDICGRNPHFLETINQAKMVSQSNSSILLLGKSGTGKDIISQAIHNASPRKNAPYVAINCAAIPRDLIASELFGHMEGSFTGSRKGGSQGKFELADGGTIFLDEIAEMSLELQAVLLRVIEDKSIIRIGGEKVKPVDVRIIAATNKDLREEIQKGTFREDLFYRLNVFTIQMVPLSDRKDDIPLLVDLFVRKSALTMGKTITKIAEEIIQTFMNYSWPGNVRELQNVIERMMNYVTTDELTADLIPSEIRQNQQVPEVNYDMESMKDIEYQILKKMVASGLSKKEMAQKMKIARSSLYRKLRNYDLFVP